MVFPNPTNWMKRWSLSLSVTLTIVSLLCPS
jgi:hypothetical protein